jgi:hypothetical protein
MAIFRANNNILYYMAISLSIMPPKMVASPFAKGRA